MAGFTEVATVAELTGKFTFDHISANNGISMSRVSYRNGNSFVRKAHATKTQGTNRDAVFRYRDIWFDN